MREQVCMFLRENRDMLDINGVTLDELREAYINYRQEPPDGTVLEPPRVTCYDSAACKGKERINLLQRQ